MHRLREKRRKFATSGRSERFSAAVNCTVQLYGPTRRTLLYLSGLLRRVIGMTKQSERVVGDAADEDDALPGASELRPEL